jgi:hypothetical protein
MGAPKGNDYAKGNNGGNPGRGKLAFVRQKVTEHSELWWSEWETMMKGERDDKHLAMKEFNKLQTKMIPQDMDVGGQVIVQIAKQIADKYDAPQDTSDSR